MDFDHPTAHVREKFQLGRVYARAFSVLWKKLPVFLGLGVFLGSAPQALLSMSAVSPWADPFGSFVWSVLHGLVTGSVGSLLEAAVAFVALQTFADRPLRPDIAAVLRKIPVVLTTGVIKTLGVRIATLVFLIPGMILATMWAVAVPAAAMERKGPLNALERSSDLTDGHRWIVLGALICVLAPVGILAGVGMVWVRGALANGPWMLRTVVVPLSAAVTQPLMGVVIASIYFELRHIKEGLGVREMASVFD